MTQVLVLFLSRTKKQNLIAENSWMYRSLLAKHGWRMESSLVVLGGFGKSDTVGEGERQIQSFADNDSWFDDVSDGPVSAEVKFDSSGQLHQAKHAWIIVTPPDFAPENPNIVSLYDVVSDTLIRDGRLPEIGKPSFKNDIFPIFYRAFLYQWVQLKSSACTWFF